MARYAYAPLSVEEGRGTGRRLPHEAAAEAERAAKVADRMPMFVGICVLVAITFVLSRSPQAQGGGTAVTGSGGNVNAAVGGAGVATVPEGTATVGGSSSSSSQATSVLGKNGENNVPPVIQVSPPVKDAPSTVTTASITSSTTSDKCDCEGKVDPSSIDLGALRAAALDATPPHIIECSAASAGESQSACHLPKSTRYAALQQKGATLWMTGCSGAGKTTIATALEDRLVKVYGKHVYRLDGDNLRTGINRDLTFSEADRAESVRRTGEIATLFADSGVITLVGLISPYRGDRDAVRKRHEDQGIPFYEIFLDVPVDELKKRDPKGQYARVESGELKHFTCIDDPYEPPISPEITLKTHELEIEQSADILFRRLEMDGVLEGAPKISPPGLPNPDGDEMIDLHVPEHLKAAKMEEAERLPKVLITDLDLNWLQVIGEGWASPLKGFMREGTLLEVLHFNSILVDPFNLTENKDIQSSTTNFEMFKQFRAPDRVSMSVPITLSCTDYTKAAIESSSHNAVALTTQMGNIVAILRNPEVYPNRKEEIVARMFGVIDPGHPYIKEIYKGGDHLIGGEVELLDRIRYNDGLDKWRKTSTEIMEEFKEKGADTVYAFQTRNPTHAGHAYLMRSAGENLKKEGYKNPVLWLSPLGGWTKEDDVPLDVRVNQHEEVLNSGLEHPGGLDPATTVMAIWPSPMVYAGPTEVQFHAKSRRSAGASYFVVGRDPAGMKGSNQAVAHTDDDLYDGDHGRYVLQNSPGIGSMKMLSFVKVMYDITDNVMKVPDDSRLDDFISISGSKMRLLARNGAVPCSTTDIPTDLVEANCVPSGFMIPKGWDIVVDYYKNIDSPRWIPWSRPVVDPGASSRTEGSGKFGTGDFQLKHKDYESFWHDIPVHPSSGEDMVVNFITEIPLHMTAKMELQKALPGNPISQDSNSDGSPRYYTYGTPFFNYGYIPQTWEDPALKDSLGNGGDNDPLDVMEIGSNRLEMGSITPCRVLGHLELIDEGEMDNKVLCIALSDPDASRIHNVGDLERAKPGTVDRLKDWLKRYKTSDGKPENALASEDVTSAKEAMELIGETHARWKNLCGKGTGYTSGDHGFWLDAAGCKGR